MGAVQSDDATWKGPRQDQWKHDLAESCRTTFSTARNFHDASAHSWRRDPFPAVGLRETERSGARLRAASTLPPHFRGKCEQQVRILFLSDRAAAWHMTSRIHTNTACAPKHTHRHPHCSTPVCIYLSDELVLSDRVDPAGVSLRGSLWNPPNFTANQLSGNHTHSSMTNVFLLQITENLCRNSEKCGSSCGASGPESNLGLQNKGSTHLRLTRWLHMMTDDFRAPGDIGKNLYRPLVDVVWVINTSC